MKNIFFDLTPEYRKANQLPDLVHAFIQSKGNSKTGACIAHYALPWDAVRRLNDDVKSRKVVIDDFKDTCGHCPLQKGHKGTKCYVLHGNYPRLELNAVIRGVATNAYEYLGTLDETNFYHPIFYRQFIRFGAFGEGVDVGKPIIDSIMNTADFHTGYTRKWMKKEFQWSNTMFQASVFNHTEEALAEERGFSTYRLIQKSDDYPMVNGDSELCPASKEAERQLTCAQCRMCDGTKNIYINEH